MLSGRLFLLKKPNKVNRFWTFGAAKSLKRVFAPSHICRTRLSSTIEFEKKQSSRKLHLAADFHPLKFLDRPAYETSQQNEPLHYMVLGFEEECQRKAFVAVQTLGLVQRLSMCYANYRK